MTAISNIVIADAAATPVNHTFKPSRQGLRPDNVAIAEWRDRDVNSGIPVGAYAIDATFSQSSPSRPTFRLGLKLKTPVMENVTNSTISGIAPAPTISFTPEATVTFVLPERSALQNRKYLRKLLVGALNDPQVIAAIEGLEFPI